MKLQDMSTIDRNLGIIDGLAWVAEEPIRNVLHGCVAEISAIIHQESEGEDNGL